MDLKIRLFALAKELGIDSKVLIEHCISAGLKVKNSPLASISPEERDLVLGHLKSAGPPIATAAPTEEAQMTPFARDTAREVGRIRSIKPVVSRPPLAREPATSVVESEPVPETEVPPSSDVDDEIPSAEELPQAVAESEPPAVEPAPVPSIVAPGPVRSPLLRRSGSGTEKPADVSAEGPIRPAPPNRQEEYLPPGGVRSSSSIREMKPRGTISESEQAQQRRPKPKWTDRKRRCEADENRKNSNAERRG